MGGARVCVWWVGERIGTSSGDVGLAEPGTFVGVSRKEGKAGVVGSSSSNSGGAVGRMDEGAVVGC